MSDHDQTREQLLEELQTLRTLLSANDPAEADREPNTVWRDRATRFQAFLDSSPAISFMKDAAGRYVYVSKTVRQYVGRDADQLLGKTDFDLWPDALARQYRDNDLSVLALGKPRELVETLPGGDGEPRHFLSFKFPFRDACGTQLLGGVSVDITARKQTEERQNEYAERLQALSRRLAQVQEEERRRLASELHDEIGQSLTGLRFALEAAGEVASDAAAPRLNEARALLEEILRQVRALSFDLRPALLDHLGLLAALHSLFERYTARTRIQVQFKHAGLEGRLPPEIETAVYRVVQEALTNVARHAGVPEAAVRVWVNAGVLEVQIEDQGVGFAAEAILATNHSSGLPGMLERVNLLNGQLTIASAPGSGTHLLARLPLAGSLGRKIDEHFLRLGR